MYNINMCSYQPTTTTSIQRMPNLTKPSTQLGGIKISKNNLALKQTAFTCSLPLKRNVPSLSP